MSPSELTPISSQHLMFFCPHLFLGLIQASLQNLVLETETEKGKREFCLYTSQWDCLPNVPFSGIIIIIIIYLSRNEANNSLEAPMAL